MGIGGMRPGATLLVVAGLLIAGVICFPLIAAVALIGGLFYGMAKG